MADESTFIKRVIRKKIRGKWKVNFLGEISASGLASALYAHGAMPTTLEATKCRQILILLYYKKLLRLLEYQEANEESSPLSHAEASRVKSPLFRRYGSLS